MSALDRENLNIGRAINQAAGELPGGWEIRIEIERHSGNVRLFNPEGIETTVDSGEMFSDQIQQAIDIATGDA